MFESSTSLEVHLSYHKENLLTRWAAQDTPTSTSTANSTPSSSANNMESKNQHQEVSPHGRGDQQSPPSVTPYFQGQYILSSSQYNNNTGDPPTTTSSGNSANTTTTYRPTPSYPDGDHPHQLYGTPTLQHQQQQQLFSPPTQRQQQHYERNESDPSRDPPPPIKTERPAETPAEILDLDSNKVHVYHLPHQQPLGNFYRPYLMSQGPPPPNNGWPLPPGDHFSPAFSQEPPPHHHHLAHIYGAPPPGSNPIMYDFIPDSNQRPTYTPTTDHQAPPPMGYPPQSAGTPNFRGNFPPQSSIIAENIGSPGGPLTPGQRPSPPNSTTPVTQGKKGKKAGQVKNNANNNNEGSPAPKTKGWKGGECKRPKTYNCVACNKWFTSSGHLKRHYGTTLHKVSGNCDSW